MGLFSHYSASPETISASAKKIMTEANSVSEVGNEAIATHQPACSAVTGSLSAPVSTAVQPVQEQRNNSTDLASFAGGVVGVFSDDVTRYNEGIDRLNREWDTAVATDFGVPAADIASDATPSEASEARGDHAGQVSSARAAKLADLRRRKRELDDKLDRDAGNRQEMLGRGPNADDAAQIAASGTVQNIQAGLNALWPHPDRTAATTLAFTTPSTFSTVMSKELMKTMPGRMSKPYWQRTGFAVDSKGVATQTGRWTQSYQGPKVVEDTAGRAKWSARAKVFSRAGTAATALISGVDQWNADSGKPTDERVGRAVTQGATMAGAAWAGAQAGAAIGTAIPVPVVGTVVGAAAGAVIGAGAMWAMDKFNDPLVDLGGKAGDVVGDGIDKAGEALDDVGDKVSGAVDDLTPW